VKRLLLLTFFSAFFMSGIVAQSLEVGVVGGLELAGGVAKEPGIPIKGSPGFGFALGGMADVFLPNKQFSVRATLTFQHVWESDNSNGYTGHIHVSALCLPIDFVYHTSLANGRLFFGLGPYADMALGGHFSGTQGTDDAYPIEFGAGENNDIKRMDYGLDLLAGFQLNTNMQLTARFDWGLRDVSADTQAEQIHIRNFGVSFIYLIPTMVPKMK
jgi:hypothetical protein